jgi:NAD(P)-dependent dehydrogenase (short-subunit alcohol dehydrogenase family)
VDHAVAQFGRLDILVNDAALQRSHAKLEDISAEEWDRTFRTNIYSVFYLSQAALPHMKPGSTIINTSSINAKAPSPKLLAYATTKGAIANFTSGLAQLLVECGIRVNCVAPGPCERLSSHPPCRRRKSRISARTRRSSARRNPPSSRLLMYCSPPARQATSPAPCLR